MLMELGFQKQSGSKRDLLWKKIRKRSKKEYWDLRSRVVRDASGVGVFKNN